MKSKKEKAHQVLQILNNLFPSPEIPLQHCSPYTLLIAVLLSAQCTDVCVNKITPALFARASTPQAMAQLSVADIQQIIRPCGLSGRKAQAIKDLSQILIDKFQGQVPCDFEQLESLPGVGHKTASVVMSQAFGIPAFPVDTHIHRCSQRWGLASGKSVVDTERELKKLFPPESWNKLHLQIIYFARAYCPARNHDPASCPICSMILETAIRKGCQGQSSDT
jgi:endonuclease-3